MYYEINVSVDGRYYFATAKRSITSPDKAIRVYNDFVNRFPTNEGYEIECTFFEETGKILSRAEIAKHL